MIANWKSLAVLLIGLAAFVSLGPPSDSGNSEIAQQVSAIAPGCGTHAGRCIFGIRFTYPAADLSVLSDDALLLNIHKRATPGRTEGGRPLRT